MICKTIVLLRRRILTLKKLQQPLEIQFPKMNIDHLLKKPYVNGITLTNQNLSLKSH